MAPRTPTTTPIAMFRWKLALGRAPVPSSARLSVVLETRFPEGWVVNALLVRDGDVGAGVGAYVASMYFTRWKSKSTISIFPPASTATPAGPISLADVAATLSVLPRVLAVPA